MTHTEIETQDPRWIAAIDALLRCSSVSAAAKEVGVTERTLYRWLANPDFAADYRKARRQVVFDTVGVLQTLTKKAAQTLERNLNCSVPGIETRAAVAVLHQTFRGLEVAEFDARLSELEFQVKEKQKDKDDAEH